jgi:nucleoside 2-deoxyribosyltransferase
MYLYEIGAITKHWNKDEYSKASNWRVRVDFWARGTSYVKTFNPFKYYVSAQNIDVDMRTVVVQNEYFINKCNIAICNMEDIEDSPGSIYELTRFKTQGKPVIAFGQPSKSPHIMSCLTCVVATLEEGLMYDKCEICNSKNLEKRDIKTAKDSEGVYETDFTLYCKDCGRYVGTFSEGHWEY